MNTIEKQRVFIINNQVKPIVYSCVCIIYFVMFILEYRSQF